MQQEAFLFGAAYYPEHRPAERWEYDLDMMAGAAVNALRVGEFAWKRFEPEDERYALDWMVEFGELAWQRRIGLLLCPPLRTVPAWLVAKDPSVKLENEQGIRLEFGSRYSFCINHPWLRERAIRLAEVMGQRFGGAPYLVGWHLDNEYGDEPDCHCPICRERFQEWLRRQYGSIETLNVAWGNVFWGLEYSGFEQVPTPRRSKTVHNPGHLQAWRTFRSECNVEIIRLHAQAVQRAGGTQPITTNFQTWNHRTDYYPAAKHLDVCGTNFYPPYGKPWTYEYALANARSYRQQNFQVHELRNSAHAIPGASGNTPAPGEVQRLTMHTVAHGADAIYYFAWRGVEFGPEQTHGTITDYDGRPRRVYAEVKETGENLRRIWPMLRGTTVVSKVATLHDLPTTWVMETDSDWVGDRGLYNEHYARVRRAVRKLHVR